MIRNHLVHIRPAPDVLFQEFEGETMLVNLETGQYHGLDEVGTRFWQLLTEHEDVNAAVTRMLAEYEVDEETLRDNIATLVAELSAAGLVVPAE